MRRFNYKLLALVMLLFAGTACNEIIETEPVVYLSEEGALEDYAGVSATLVGAYDVIRNSNYYGRGMIINPEVMADNCRPTDDNSNRHIGQSKNQEGSHIAIWTPAYASIARINLVLSAVDAVTDASGSNAETVKADAYFLRALVYHDLARVYGREPGREVSGFNLCVPLVTTPFTTLDDPNTYPIRATNTEVYAQIHEDLDNAIDLFGANSLGGVYRGSKTAAIALKARVYLYQGNYEKAAEFALQAITEGPALVSGEGYMSIYTGTGEAIFTYRITSGESLSTNSIASLYGQNEDGSGGYGDIVPTTKLENLYDMDDADTTSADARFAVFRLQEKNSEPIWYNEKFKSYRGAFGADNVPLIRASEMYLTYAEACAEPTNVDGSANANFNEDNARDYLNQIYNRAFGEDYDNLASFTGNSLMTEILKQRQIELAFEGHRFFDLKRRGLNIAKDYEGLPAVQYDDHRVVARIPDSEIDVNPNLIPNPGY